VFAPIAKAKDNAATIVNAGFLASIRIPKTRSCHKVVMLTPPVLHVDADSSYLFHVFLAAETGSRPFFLSRKLLEEQEKLLQRA